MPAPARLARAILACLPLALAASCASERPLYLVRTDAERAYARGDYHRALIDYEEYVRRDPADARIRHDLGRTLLRLGRDAEAAEHLYVAVDLAPYRDEYRQTLAEALARSGQVPELFSRLRARAEQTGDWRDYLTLGRYAEQVGDADEAELAYRTAARLDGGRSAEPQLALARLYEATGARDDAARRYRMALYIDPENSAARDGLRRLGHVPGPSLALEPEERQ